MKTLLATCRITIKTGTGILVNSAGLVTVTHTTKPLGAASTAIEIDIWLSGSKTRYALPYSKAKQVSATRIDASATLTIANIRWMTVSDTWQATSDGISITRTIDVHTQQNPGCGFAHRFVLPVDAAALRQQCDVF
ncbi:MAG: hypothetical protein ACOVP2_13770, partial [Armatimonadaceae bacterium]